MALILKPNKTYKTQFGEEITTAYLTIKNVRIAKDSVEITAAIYQSKEARESARTDANILPISFITEVCTENISDFFPLIPEEPTNPFKQAYLYLVSIDEGSKYSDWETDE